MRLLLSFLPCAVLLLSAAKAPACSISPVPNGVMCLDEATGKPLWEYFPDQLGLISIKSDAHHIFVVFQEFRNPDFSIKEEPTMTVTAVDLVTGKEVVGPVQLPPDDPSKTSPNPWGTLFTSAGDRLAFNPHNDRAITVFQGEGPDVRTIISTGLYSGVVVHGNVITYALSYVTPDDTARPTVIAVDSITGKQLWQIDDAPEIHGLYAGASHLYVSEEGHLRAIEPLTGRIAWRKELPRLRGQSRVIEHDGRLFVNCDYNGEDPPLYFLYCLNAKNGDIEWTLNPGHLPFLFRDGKVYTMALPTRLMSIWRHADVMDSFQASKTPKWHADRDAFVRQQFLSKTPEEIELNMRSWHALGDRSGLVVLQSAAVARADPASQELARSLINSFPKVRNPMRLMDFLEKEFEQHAELRTEIRRILEDFNPVPFWMEESNKKYNSYRRKPIPQFELTSDESRLIDAFRKLKARADDTPIDRLTNESLADLVLHKGTATFDSLVKAHDDSSDPQYRMMVRIALYTAHPDQASNWALDHLNEITPQEITQWVQRATIEWLLAHEELFLKWMFHEDRSVQTFSSHRLSRLDDPASVVPLCIRLLEERVSGAPFEENEAILGAIRALGKTKDARHANLLRRFLTYKGVGEINNDSLVRDTAYRGLKAIGQEVPVSAILPPAKTEAPAAPSASARDVDIQDDMIRLRMALGNEDNSRAKQLAQRILAIIEDKSVDPDIREVAEWSLVEVYEALEEWDKAIELLLDTDSGNVNEDSLLTIYEKAERWDEIESILENSQATESITRAAFILARKGSNLEKSLTLLTRELNKHPNNSNICITLTLVHFKRDEMDAADAMMERAISLRPRPEGSHLFAQTFTHWLKRGKPEKATDWLKQSVKEDRKAWDRDDLLDWVSQFPELKATAEKLRQDKQ